MNEDEINARLIQDQATKLTIKTIAFSETNGKEIALKAHISALVICSMALGIQQETIADMLNQIWDTVENHPLEDIP